MLALIKDLGSGCTLWVAVKEESGRPRGARLERRRGTREKGTGGPERQGLQCPNAALRATVATFRPNVHSLLQSFKMYISQMFFFVSQIQTLSYSQDSPTMTETKASSKLKSFSRACLNTSPNIKSQYDGRSASQFSACQPCWDNPELDDQINQIPLFGTAKRHAMKST